MNNNKGGNSFEDSQQIEKNHSEISEQENIDEKVLTKKKSFQASMHLPVKEHVQKIEDLIEKSNKNLEEGIKIGKNYKTSLSSIEETFCLVADDFSKSVISELRRLQNDFKKHSKMELAEHNFLLKQMSHLRDDKILLDKTTEILEMRVAETEKDIGFRYVYDS